MSAIPTSPLNPTEVLKAQGAAPSQLVRLSALTDCCKLAPECLGLALVGSFAKGKGDRLSDLDLAAFVSDGLETRFMEQARAILEAQPVLHQYGRVLPGEVAFRKYVYLDSSSCELHAFSNKAGFKLYAPYIALWNPVGFLDTLAAEGPPPRHEDFIPYVHGDDGLIWELYDCIKWLQRGRTGLARDYLRKLGSALSEANGGGESGVV